jgi:hypothetical protein
MVAIKTCCISCIRLQANKSVVFTTFTRSVNSSLCFLQFGSHKACVYTVVYDRAPVDTAATARFCFDYRIVMALVC